MYAEDTHAAVRQFAFVEGRDNGSGDQNLQGKPASAASVTALQPNSPICRPASTLVKPIGIAAAVEASGDKNPF